MSFHNHDTDDYNKRYKPTERKATEKTLPVTEFELSDIEDVRIVIKAKGKHFGMVPKGDKEEARMTRIALLTAIISQYQVVNTPLEDLKQ